MTLGDVIKAYRKDHGYSMDKFSEISGISKGYISMLEKNYNPKTEMPIAPSIDVFKKVASVVNLDVNELLSMVDDQLISIDKEHSDDPQLDELAAIFRALPEAGKDSMLQSARAFDALYKKKK